MQITFLASESPKAQGSMEELVAIYGNAPVNEADVIVALGGDGFMLDVLHKTADMNIPIYGMNRGTVGFLMNAFAAEDLKDRLEASFQQIIHPLTMIATDTNGVEHKALAINEVSILRQAAQTANIRISIDGQERMENLMCDGLILSTPAGSTAYNYSAYGPILPITANVLALTPIAAFRPRRWRGAVLPDTAHVHFENTDPVKRPLMINADSQEFKNIISAQVFIDQRHSHRLLFDPGHSLEDRILQEQFV